MKLKKETDFTKIFFVTIEVVLNLQALISQSFEVTMGLMTCLRPYDYVTMRLMTGPHT